MTFQLFTETGTRNKEFISVTENKAFGLSRAFIDKYGITKSHKAVILHDNEKNKIGLYFSLNNPPFGFAVRIANEKHGGIIVARSFFDLKNINSRKYAGRYDNFEVKKLRELGLGQDGVAYIISLKEKIENPSPYDGSSEDVFEDVGDKPINLDDIPF